MSHSADNSRLPPSLPAAASSLLAVRRLGCMAYQSAWELQRELAAQRLAGEIGDTLLLEHPPTLTLGRQAKPEHLLAVRRLGCMAYQSAWELQRELAAQRLAGEIGDTLLLLEHPPTLTLGRQAKPEHLLATSAQLEQENIGVVEVDRGGDITYHGPGQLIGYPILSLREPPHRADLHLYLRDLEEVLIRTLAHFGVEAARFPSYTGAWVGMDTPTPEKIAAIGVKSSRWITQHGFALNVCPNLAHFDLIVPCGIHDYGVTSLSRQLNHRIEVQDVLPIAADAFQQVFGYKRVNEDLLPNTFHSG